MLVASNVLGRLALLVEEAVLMSPEVAGNEAPELASGYLAVISQSSNAVLLVQQIGDVPLDQVPRCFNNSLECCRRIRFEQPRLLTSWGRTVYGQEIPNSISIACGDLIIGFSGLKNYANLAVLLWATRRMSWTSNERIQAILEVSRDTNAPITTEQFLAALEAV
ncbi:MAG: hypothetical protein WCV71_05360 [Patescibacteria group bacterium]